MKKKVVRLKTWRGKALVFPDGKLCHDNPWLWTREQRKLCGMRLANIEVRELARGEGEEEVKVTEHQSSRRYSAASEAVGDLIGDRDVLAGRVALLEARVSRLQAEVRAWRRGMDAYKNIKLDLTTATGARLTLGESMSYAALELHRAAVDAHHDLDTGGKQ